MDEADVDSWLHSHDYVPHNHKAERRTRWVFVLTFSVMWIEIVAGMQFHSMALLADGWHMSTHAAAFLITLLAYRYGRIHRNDQTFAFSPAKVNILGGFASSIALAMVAVLMMVQSVERLLSPVVIQFDEAIWVAGSGLLVNIVSAWLLDDHDHSHGHHHEQAFEMHHSHTHSDHGRQSGQKSCGHTVESRNEHHSADHHHSHSHTHHDHNLRAAYFHVIADALTSVLAIVALLAGKFYGWTWLDPVMGVIGALVILVWAAGLVRETAPVLVDHSVGESDRQAIRDCLEAEPDTWVVDLHVWRITASHYAAVIALRSRQPQPPQYYHQRLQNIPHLDHVTLEIHPC